MISVAADSEGTKAPKPTHTPGCMPEVRRPAQ